MSRVPGDTAWEPLSEDVRRCLEALLAGDARRGYREQLPFTLMNHGACSCPCVYLRVDADAVAPAPVAGGQGPVVADGALVTAEDVYVGEAMLFAYDGFLADLQFCHWEDLGPLEPPLWERLSARD
ncbi:hypothetical protein ACFWBF_04205 [Streptomyces sp. NPDC060028]|uniref:hypothetical protein n=1 Tax=Streptomyces sp. NPDC060028 TaxID=3347041 RepID=UPI00367F292D